MQTKEGTLGNLKWFEFYVSLFLDTFETFSFIYWEKKKF